MSEFTPIETQEDFDKAINKKRCFHLSSKIQGFPLT